MNIHAWCCWGAALPLGSAVCVGCGCGCCQSQLGPQFSSNVVKGKLWLLFPQTLLQCELPTSPSPENTGNHYKWLFFLCAAGHLWIVWVCILQLDPSLWPWCVCAGVRAVTCPSHRAQPLLSPLWSPSTVLGLTWPFRKFAEILNKHKIFLFLILTPLPDLHVSFQRNTSVPHPVENSSCLKKHLP